MQKGIHVPNKNEASLLRKLMSESGMTEKEVRSNSKYKRMLAIEQRKCGSKGWRLRSSISALKAITKRLKLPREHPEVIKVYQAGCKSWGNYHSASSLQLLSYKDLIFEIQREKKEKRSK